MNQYRVCVYAISKNEEVFVKRWMDSVNEADIVIVVDTGSDDATVEKLQAAGAIVYKEKIEPWRFDTARNIAMEKIPIDVDICVSIDLDEVFEPGWRKKLEAAWSLNYTRASYMYIWSHNSDGTPATQFTKEKIHRRHGFRWVHPVHEILEYCGIDDDKTVWVDGLLLKHYPNSSKSRSQYLPLLELSASENPQDAQTIFWLGREYMYQMKYDLCIETLKKYLNLPSAKWNEERSAAMRFIGVSYKIKRNINNAKAWIYRAIAECPYIREPYLMMARLAYVESDWLLTYVMVIKGLEITKKSISYLTEPESWGDELYDLGAISAFYLGLYEKSYEYAIKALEMNKDDERLKTNLQLISSKINKTILKGG